MNIFDLHIFLSLSVAMILNLLLGNLTSAWMTKHNWSCARKILGVIFISIIMSVAVGIYLIAVAKGYIPS